MEDRLWFALGTVLALVSAGWSAYAFGAGRSQHTRWNNALLLLAWLAMSVFLSERGKRIGHCPLTNLFETLAFLDWSLLLTYLVIGTAYRVSVLGAFTAPVAAATGVFAFIVAVPSDVPRELPDLGWPLELHASFSLLAYGALGIGAVASALYLVQERQLKDHQLRQWFYRLPAMGDLARIQRRVLVWGFALLTLGLVAGIAVTRAGGIDWVKIVWSAGVWVLYLHLVLSPRLFGFGARRVAWCSVGSYVFILLTFWGINSLSHAHRFSS
ncbi:ABC-type uncharacterized transport system, permease component [Verrucomicrobium sp. GAS474]|uniref:cytochrome C assembly family protein n=1 Tax=Verrucomicrobium sp. GAS474 TaxID=1882831 RepID=UPI00087BDFDA|nr:cytochrome c biogenesis protein CcsA [Verrucomicrobium sp. GAS474]SDT96351.1 ABC-type uncharacterized transport system, permease component [Verrucomicrobium sp. GAS474]